MAAGYDLGSAYIQIMPSAKGIAGSISGVLDGETKNAGKQGGANIAAGLVGALKGALAAAGIGVMIKQAMDAGGALQQSFGGLDTIYGEAGAEAKKFAAEAVTAGISANTYAEQAVSFGASLKQAYGGDTVQAVKAANTAILDMADNSAKMGTNIADVQHAYQGFAKQNYTMLDNLKLGYGGTKTEMERLLVDAEKLSGVHYDISNLGDVYDAIHVIQQDLGLTGVAAAEAEGTFTGSMAAMGAATQNFLANLALGEDIETPLRIMMNSMQAFFVGNVLPMLGNIFRGIPTILSMVITEGFPLVLQTVTGLLAQLPALLPQLQASFMSLFQMLTPTFNASGLQSGVDTVNGMISGVMEAAPTMINAGADALTMFIAGANETLPGVIDAGAETINSFLDNILSGIPGILDAGAEAVTQLSAGVRGGIPDVVASAAEALASFLDTVLSHLPAILESGLNLLQSLADGAIQNIPVLLSAGVDAVAQLAATFMDHLPEILTCGIELIGQLIAGIIQKVPDVLTEAANLITQVVDAFLSYDWGELGRRIVEGVAEGLRNAAGLIVDAAVNAAKGAFNAACNFLGINSPSKLFRDEVGAMMGEGMALGFEDTDVAGRISADVSGLQKAIPANTGATYSYGGFAINVYQQPGQSTEDLVDMIESRINQRVRSRQAVFA